jgi:hypothetical protein
MMLLLSDIVKLSSGGLKPMLRKSGEILANEEYNEGEGKINETQSINSRRDLPGREAQTEEDSRSISGRQKPASWRTSTRILSEGSPLPV